MGLHGIPGVSPEDVNRPLWKCANCERIEIAHRNHLPQKCPSCQSDKGWQAVSDITDHFPLTDEVRALETDTKGNDNE